MRNLKITLLVAIAAIVTSCSRQNDAEVKPASTTKTNELKDFNLDSVRTIKLPDTLGQSRYRDTYYCSYKIRIESIGWSKFTDFDMKFDRAVVSPNRSNIIFTRNEEKVKYRVDFNPYSFNYTFDSTDE